MEYASIEWSPDDRLPGAIVPGILEWPAVVGFQRRRAHQEHGIRGVSALSNVEASTTAFDFD